jgi:hypothetical protein
MSPAPPEASGLPVRKDAGILHPASVVKRRISFRKMVTSKVPFTFLFSAMLKI